SHRHHKQIIPFPRRNVVSGHLATLEFQHGFFLSMLHQFQVARYLDLGTNGNHPHYLLYALMLFSSSFHHTDEFLAPFYRLRIKFSPDVFPHILGHFSQRQKSLSFSILLLCQTPLDSLGVWKCWHHNEEILLPFVHRKLLYIV